MAVELVMRGDDPRLPVECTRLERRGYGSQIAGSLALLWAGGENAVAMMIGVMLFGLGIGNAT
jgi:hypothetical protein